MSENYLFSIKNEFKTNINIKWGDGDDTVILKGETGNIPAKIGEKRRIWLEKGAPDVKIPVRIKINTQFNYNASSGPGDDYISQINRIHDAEGAAPTWEILFKRTGTGNASDDGIIISTANVTVGDIEK